MKIFGQFDFTWSGGPSHLGVGRATVAMEDGVGIFTNQAVLGQKEGIGVEINALSKYGIQNLNLLSAGAFLGTDNGTFVFNMQQYGLDSYREQKIGFAYARPLSDKIFASLQFNYFNLSIEEFGSVSRFATEIGFYSIISDKISMGAHIFAPAGQEITEGYPLPTRFRIGPKIEVGQGIDLLIEIEKSLDFDPIIKSGIAYQAHDKMTIFMGVIPTLSEYSLGFLYKWSNYFIKGAFTYDNILGISPSFGLFYQN